MPPHFHATSVGMIGERQRWHAVWGLPASVFLHAFLAALLIYGLRVPTLQTQEEQEVSVTFVPPAEEPNPPPEEEEKVEKPPEPEPPEPKAEKPPEPEAEKPPPPVVQPPVVQQSRIEVLKPVFEFGEKDAGPRKSLNGNSGEDNAQPPAKEDDPKPPVTESITEDKAAEPPGAEQQPDANNEATKPEEPANQAKSDKEEAALQADDQAAAPADADQPEGTTPASSDGDGEVALPATAQTPQPRPTAAPPRVSFSKPGGGNSNARTAAAVPPAAPERYAGLPGVRVLRSDVATGGARATTAMDGVPRDQRVAKLCASALQQKLVAAAYSPNLVPLIPLKMGNVLDIPDAAFRMRSTWYNLSFRCEVDTDATRVSSFSFDVGTAIPPEEWKRLGLPAGD
jgi:hypothetical protein